MALIEPYAPSIATPGQVRLWEPGHVAPRLAIEVVSASTADKDYLEVAPRYARLGTREVWVFDPARLGPASTGGPFVLSGWRWTGAEMKRVFAGDGPAFSDELGAWLVVTEDGELLRVADDADGRDLWLTGEESEHKTAEEQACRAELAEQELVALRAELARRGPAG